MRFVRPSCEIGMMQNSGVILDQGLGKLFIHQPVHFAYVTQHMDIRPRGWGGVVEGEGGWGGGRLPALLVTPLKLS